MSKTTLLALDIALNTGWALSDQKIHSGTQSFHAHQYDCAALGSAFSDWLSGMLSEHKPSAVIIERPFFRGPSSWHLSGMVWEAHRAAHHFCIPRFEYAPTSLKKFIVGKGLAKKEVVVAKIKELGFTPANDHEADAIALLLLHGSKTK